MGIKLAKRNEQQKQTDYNKLNDVQKDLIGRCVVDIIYNFDREATVAAGRYKLLLVEFYKKMRELEG